MYRMKRGYLIRGSKMLSYIASNPTKDLIEDVCKELNITILKIPFDEFKTTNLYNEVSLAPSIILIKEGKIIKYLDPEQNKDLSKYQDKKEFISWIKEYINI